MYKPVIDIDDVRNYRLFLSANAMNFIKLNYRANYCFEDRLFYSSKNSFLSLQNNLAYTLILNNGNMINKCSKFRYCKKVVLIRTRFRLFLAGKIWRENFWRENFWRGKLLAEKIIFRIC
jgi:hypothetical protein